jgi:hypothetical protein
MDDTFMLIGIVCITTSLIVASKLMFVCAQVLFSVTAGLCIACSHYGSGQFARNLPPLAMAKAIKVCFIDVDYMVISSSLG